MNEQTIPPREEVNLDRDSLLRLYEQDGWQLVLFHLREIERRALQQIAGGVRTEFHAGCISAAEQLKEQLRLQCEGVSEENFEIDIDTQRAQQADAARFGLTERY